VRIAAFNISKFAKSSQSLLEANFVPINNLWICQLPTSTNNQWFSSNQGVSPARPFSCCTAGRKTGGAEEGGPTFGLDDLTEGGVGCPRFLCLVLKSLNSSVLGGLTPWLVSFTNRYLPGNIGFGVEGGFRV